jgi:hypothetical protein
MTKLKLGAILGALAVFTGGAAAAAEIRVPVAGKSTEQVHADIVKAATDACWSDLRGEPMAGYIYPNCVRASVKRAVAQIGDAKLSAYAEAAPARAVAP